MDYLAITGLVLNTIGSVLLAISLNKTLGAFENSIFALETFKETFTNGGAIVSFTGLEKHRKNALKDAKLKTNCGLWLLALGFAFQLISLISSASTKAPLQDSHPTPQAAP